MFRTIATNPFVHKVLLTIAGYAVQELSKEVVRTLHNKIAELSKDILLEDDKDDSNNGYEKDGNINFK
ncbi:MAG: hypothetical protein K8F60_03240 [Melioribacteraceae bacterium]|nr:hypothetical protein [Melioribacteraceae bacterium]